MSDAGAPPPADGNGSRPAVREPSPMVVLAPGPGAPAPAGRRPDWLVGQLPVGMLDDNFFYRFVSIFQEEAGTYLDGIDNLGNILDPAVAPPSMVRFMAGWLALPAINPALDELYQRRLVLQASKLQWWRGTKRGLSGLLELLTGGPVEVVDTGGVFRQGEARRRPAQVVVKVEHIGWLSEPDLVDLVRDEVPANVDLQLFVGDRRIFPVDDVSTVALVTADEEATFNGHEEARSSDSEMKPVF
jgi:phage tail-like protein